MHSDSTTRREFHESKLLYDFEDLVVGILEDIGVSRSELAKRLGVTPSWVSQLLGDSANPRLRTIAALGWALGIEFRLNASEMSNREETPAEGDPPLPAWVEKFDSARDAASRGRVSAFHHYEPVPPPAPPTTTSQTPVASGAFSYAA